MVSSDKCGRRCNTVEYSWSKVCVPNQTEDVNLNVFNMITENNESKTLIKHILCDCRCKFDSRNGI